MLRSCTGGLSRALSIAVVRRHVSVAPLARVDGSLRCSFLGCCLRIHDLVRWADGYLARSYESKQTRLAYWSMLALGVTLNVGIVADRSCILNFRKVRATK